MDGAKLGFLNNGVNSKILNSVCFGDDVLFLIVVPDNAPDAGKVIECDTPQGGLVYFGTVRQSLQLQDASILLKWFNRDRTTQTHYTS